MASSASSSKKRSSQMRHQDKRQQRILRIRHQDKRQQRILRIRHQIDACDQKLAQLIIKRLGLGKKIQHIKKSLGLKSKDLAREKEILAKLARHYPQLPKPLLKKIYSALFVEVRRK